MTATVYTLSEFVQGVSGDRRICGRTRSGRSRISWVRWSGLSVVRTVWRIWSRTARRTRTAGFVIHRAENLSVLAVVWPEGSGAPVHNHNGWAMEGVISGVEVNRNFTRTDDGESSVGGDVGRDAVDGSADGADDVFGGAAVGHSCRVDSGGEDAGDSCVRGGYCERVAVWIRSGERQGDAVPRSDGGVGWPARVLIGSAA